MHNNELYSLVETFRCAIIKAVRDGKLSITPFTYFPDGCCDMASEMLAQYLYDQGIETVMVNGANDIDGSRHVWLRTLDGINIDITAYQFEGSIKGISNISKTIIGDEDSIHRIYAFAREECPPMCVEDNIYNEEYRNSWNRRERDLYIAYSILLEDYL